LDRFAAMTAFVAVVDHKGFAAAARHLHVAPSAVTRLIGALEDGLGVRLLRRTTRSLSLTDAGERYLGRARVILSELRDVEDSARAERVAPRGRLVVTAPAVFGRLHVAPLMSAFLAHYPEVVGELSLTDRTVSLVEEGIDLAVRIGSLADSSLLARRMGATRRVVVGAPAYLARRGTPAAPADLAGHDLIRFASLSTPAEWRFRQDGVDLAVSVSPRFITDSADAAIGQAEQGGGLTMVLGYQVAAAVRAGRLTIVLAEFEPPPLPIHIVQPAGRLVPAAVRAFVDLAVTQGDWQFGDDTAYGP
jgi:DNA-binding transcriptional LysR family regulator